MMTSLGTISSTNEKTIAQADLKLLGLTVESLVVEFDQDKFEQLLSSSTKETHSQVFLETSHREAHTLFDKASSSTFLGVLTTSRAFNMAYANVSQ